MINFALCFEENQELDFMKDVIIQFFQQRGNTVAVRCYHSAYELERCISCNCPDILFYDLESEDGRMRKAALAAKRSNADMISIVTKSRDYIPHIEDQRLEPMYTIPDRNRTHLLSYASLAYEMVLDDSDAFSYYVRPQYVHVPIEEIRYFASEGRRTHIVSDQFRDTFYQKLDDVEKLLSHKNGEFLRIHKSYLVNTSFICSYSRDFVTLITGERLRISKYQYYKILNDRFRNSGLKRLPQYAV